MSNPLFHRVDEKFREHLRSTGQNGTHHRTTIPQVFLSEHEASHRAKKLHSPVKAVNFSGSFHCIYQTMTLLVKSGLAKEIIQDDGTARRYTHDFAIAGCNHKHMVCKDCGAGVQP